MPAPDQPRMESMSNLEIREHMAVISNDGQHVGTVDHVDGEQIKLTKSGANSGGQHHFIPLRWVDGIEAGEVKLTKPYQQAIQDWVAAG
jgi:hypothetical protein